MIYGIGIDLVEMDRIEQILERKENRFVHRIFTDRELRFCPKHRKRRVEYLAGRFAGKEAVAKALGTGIGSQLKWTDIEILPLDTGKPYVNLKHTNWDAKELLIHISISHTNIVAAAKVVIEQK